jgi:hypothetical protein
LNSVDRRSRVGVGRCSRRRRYRESRYTGYREYEVIPRRVVRLRERPAEVYPRRIRQADARRRDPRAADRVHSSATGAIVGAIGIHVHAVAAAAARQPRYRHRRRRRIPRVQIPLHHPSVPRLIRYRQFPDIIRRPANRRRRRRARRIHQRQRTRAAHSARTVPVRFRHYSRNFRRRHGHILTHKIYADRVAARPAARCNRQTHRRRLRSIAARPRNRQRHRPHRRAAPRRDRQSRTAPRAHRRRTERPRRSRRQPRYLQADRVRETPHRRRIHHVRYAVPRVHRLHPWRRRQREVSRYYQRHCRRLRQCTARPGDRQRVGPHRRRAPRRDAQRRAASPAHRRRIKRPARSRRQPGNAQTDGTSKSVDGRRAHRVRRAAAASHCHRLTTRRPG